MADTAMDQKLAIDRDMMAARQTATQIVALLDGFIPDRCRREAYQYVLEAAYKEGMEFTSKLMRKEYEAWKALTLELPTK